LAAEFSEAIRRAHAQLRATTEGELLTVRLVGRAKLPSTTIGLLVHAAEHTARHVGQLMTTAKVVAGR
jgi:2-iminoacetate synthase ThiH